MRKNLKKFGYLVFLFFPLLLGGQGTENIRRFSVSKLPSDYATANVPFARYDITGFTGGGANLDGVVTAGAKPPLGNGLPTGVVFDLRIASVNYRARLRAGTDAENSPEIVRPDDYHASTNARVWEIHELGGASVDLSGYMTKAANLSDVANVATARDNLGLGTAATADVGGEAGGIVPSGASLLHNRYVVHNGGEIFTSNERPPRFATTDPTVNDDSDAEYGVGTRWHNTVTGRVWVSFDDTDGAAVWRELARHDDTRFPTADEKADLAAAAALSGTGLLAQTSTGNYALRTIADDASGNITWANPAGIAGNPLATLDSSLAAINSITSATGQGLTLATLDSNADLTLDPHGTGRIVLPNATRLWLPGQAAGGFALSTSGTTFDGTVNEVLYLGYNLGPGGTRIDTGDAAIGIEIEGNYDTGATHYTELHFKGIDTAGVSTRWMTFIVPRLNSRQAAINFNTDDRIYFNSGDGSLQTAVLFRDASSSELQLFGPGSDQWRIRAFNDGRIIFHDQTAGTFPFQIGANYLEAGGSTVLRFYGSSSADAGLAHNASAGTLEINSGTIGALRDLALRALTASTTVTTAAGVAWDLGGYTAGAPTADGYLTVIAGGATYRIAADLQ